MRLERMVQNNADNERQLLGQNSTLEKEISSLKDILMARNLEIEDLLAKSNHANATQDVPSFIENQDHYLAVEGRDRDHQAQMD
jgi:hypothetical protein